MFLTLLGSAAVVALMLGMASYGRQVIANIGTSVRVSADGNPEVKVGGVTIDWTTVAPAAAAITLVDGVSILVGDLYLRYGQVITLITTAAVQVVTLTNSPTGGTFTLTVVSEVNGVSVTATTAAIAYNATGPVGVQAALRALNTIPGASLITATGSASGPYTVNFDASSGYVTLTGDGSLLTGGGSQPAVSVSVTDTGGNVGKYGPYDPDATDGRQTLTQGSCFILDRTVKFNDLYSDHPPGVLFGGQVFLARIIQAGGGTHTLAAGPTLSELKTAFPRLQLITENPAAG